MGLGFRTNGKENGNDHNGFRVEKEWKRTWKLITIMGYLGTTVSIHPFIPS